MPLVKQCKVSGKRQATARMEPCGDGIGEGRFLLASTHARGKQDVEEQAEKENCTKKTFSIKGRYATT